MTYSVLADVVTAGFQSPLVQSFARAARSPHHQIDRFRVATAVAAFEAGVHPDELFPVPPGNHTSPLANTVRITHHVHAAIADLPVALYDLMMQTLAAGDATTAASILLSHAAAVEEIRRLADSGARAAAD